MQKNIGSKLQTSTIVVSGPRQAVALDSFLEAAILLSIFLKMLRNGEKITVTIGAALLPYKKLKKRVRSPAMH